MLVTTLAHGKLVFDRFAKFPWNCVDSETEAVPPWKGKKDTLTFGRSRITMWSLCYRGESYSFPTYHLSPQYPTPSQWFQLYRPILASKKVEIAFWNANYDVTVIGESIEWFKIRRLYDAMIGAWMADASYDKKLKSRAARYGRFLQETKHVNFKDKDELADYAEQDVVATDEGVQMQRFGFVDRPKRIPALNAQGKLVYSDNPMPTDRLIVPHETLREWDKVWLELIEHPVLRSTMRAERMGFPLSAKYLARIERKMKKDQARLLKTIFKKAGKVINLKSKPQLVELFTKLKIKNPYRTKTGLMKFDKYAMARLREMHPLVNMLIQQGQIATLLSFYIGGLNKKGLPNGKGLPHYINPKTKRIHPSLATVGTKTGRFSASLPNLQQIPSRADIYQVKKAFRAPKGKLIICFDYAGLELRIGCFYHCDSLMMELLRDPEKDMHGMTAQELSVPRDPVAKETNFLLQYHGASWALAEHLTNKGAPTTVDQAAAYHTGYHSLYPGVDEDKYKMLAEYKHFGFVTYFTGRRRRMDVPTKWDDKRSVHKVETTLANNRVQGCGQDFMKAAIIRTDHRCINVDAEVRQRVELDREHDLLLRDYARKVTKNRRLLQKAGVEHYSLQVHDEGIWFADEKAAEDVAPIIGEMMCWKHPFPRNKRFRYSVPLVVEGGLGVNWKQAKSKEPIKSFKLGHGVYELEDAA